MWIKRKKTKNERILSGKLNKKNENIQKKMINFLGKWVAIKWWGLFFLSFIFLKLYVQDSLHNFKVTDWR